jgi:hypothetical protein
LFRRFEDSPHKCITNSAWRFNFNFIPSFNHIDEVKAKSLAASRCHYYQHVIQNTTNSTGWLRPAKDS